MTSGPVLVVGGGGLLGSAVRRRLARSARAVGWPQVDWDDERSTRQALEAAIDDLLRAADGGPWSIAWCAGAAVTATAGEDLEAELRTLSTAMDHLRGHGPASLARGALVLASSAGGVHAGAGPAPFTEESPTGPLSPYGTAKVRAEGIAAALADDGVRVLLARLSNLYGPQQNLAKPQGLIAQICLAQLTGAPISIYVPLDTLRDYLYVDDAAGLLVDALARVHLEDAGALRVKILAAHRSASIAEVLGEFRRVTRRPPRVILGSSPIAARQARDLRFRSVVWTDLDRRPLTGLAAGIHATHLGLARALQAGALRRWQGAHR